MCTKSLTFPDLHVVGYWVKYAFVIGLDIISKNLIEDKFEPFDKYNLSFQNLNVNGLLK